MSEAAERIMEMGQAFRAAKALMTADELGLFTTLARTGPLDGESLRTRLGIHDRGARDFFDALVALGMLQRDGDGRYRNDEIADEYLDQDKDSYVGGILKLCNSRQYSSWAGLTEALRTGIPNPGFKTTDIRERHYFDALYEDPDRAGAFLKAMTGGGLLPARALVAQFPWHHRQVVLDIGCAEGRFLVQLAQAHSHITGIGFDLPAARPWFENYTKAHNLLPRLRFQPGDFLCDPLPAADTVVFGRVLHNWNLATKKLLLTKAYEALPQKGEIIIYERLIDDDRRTNANALLSSLNMLLMTSGGFDFSAAECMDWLREAGFRDVHSKVLTSSHSLVVGTK
jgi:SAM-dependent methyltransferase